MIVKNQAEGYLRCARESLQKNERDKESVERQPDSHRGKEAELKAENIETEIDEMRIVIKLREEGGRL